MANLDAMNRKGPPVLSDNLFKLSSGNIVPYLRLAFHAIAGARNRRNMGMYRAKAPQIHLLPLLHGETRPFSSNRKCEL